MLLSFAVIFFALRTINFCSIDESFGVLVIMVEYMLKDLWLFIELAVLIMIGFGLAIAGLSSARFTSFQALDSLTSAFHAGGGATPTAPPHRQLKGDGHDEVDDFAPVASALEGGGEVDGFRAIGVIFWAFFGELELDYFVEAVP